MSRNLCIVVLGLLLSACGSSARNASRATAVPPAATAPGQPAASPQVTQLTGSGDTSYNDSSTNRVVTIDGAVIDPNGDGTAHLKTGNVFLIVRAELDNNGSEEDMGCAPYQFAVVDQAGHKYDQTDSFPKRDGKEFGSSCDNLGAGDSISGSIAYQIPRGTTKVKVMWDDLGGLDPAETVFTFVHRLTQNKPTASLGVQVTQQVAQFHNRPMGAYIQAVKPGSAAAKAGLQIRDIIAEVNGHKITDQYSLEQIITSKSPGDTVTLTIWRSGKTFTRRVKLGARS